MQQSSAVLNAIPRFLRRPRERAPSKLEIKSEKLGPAAPRAPLPRPETTIHGGTAPVRPDFLAADKTEAAPAPSAPPNVIRAPLAAVASGPAPAPRVAAPMPAYLSAPLSSAYPPPRRAALPWLAPKAAPAGRDGVVDLTAHRGAADSAPRRVQQDLRAALAADLTKFGENTGDDISDDARDDIGDDDIAFQVTLPRSVIRQIRLLAAEEETTHRAVILRVLRAAGLAVPDGADVDRRANPARRRQQA